MRGGLHPVVMIALLIAAALFGRVLPVWTLSLATVAASNALIALGIVVLARTGNVSFGQGLFFAAGGYGVALIANAWGITDAVAQVIIGGTRRHAGGEAANMPAFGDAYSDAEIASVANYVTTRFGTQGSRLTSEQVAELRAKD